MSKDLKYLVAYIAPLLAYVNVIEGGYWSFSTAIFLFGLLPLVDLIAKGDTANLTDEEEASQAGKFFFDFLLYLNVPILFGLLFLYFNQMENPALLLYERIGMSLGVGMMVGSLGINVAHELGHRAPWFERTLSKALLMTALYMHFHIEHNQGHHKFVATEEDPSSARIRETVYAFWFRSITGAYLKAWKIEFNRLDKLGLSRWGINNQIIHFQLIQFIYLMSLVVFWSWAVAGYAIFIAFLGILLLETVNYIEHYGLRRKKKASGRYEPVGPHHSWNSNNDMGRIFLYELTRHSDHHFKATRKYQILRHFDQSPQLPTGYPGSILIALVPAFWFKLMDRRVHDFNQKEVSYV